MAVAVPEIVEALARSGLAGRPGQHRRCVARMARLANRLIGVRVVVAEDHGDSREILSRC